jgi:hypothetical protein
MGVGGRDPHSNLSGGFAPGPVVAAKEMAWARNAPRANEVGRGIGQGYFAYGAGGCGFESHLVHMLKASSSRDRAPNVPDRVFPSSRFEEEGGRA